MSGGVDKGMVIGANEPPIVPTDQVPTEGHMPPTANAGKMPPPAPAVEVVSSGLVDSGAATSWGDLPEDDWQNAALRASTAEAREMDLIGAASRDPDSDQFAYVRLAPENARQLRDALSAQLDERRQVFLDPRITADAASALLSGADLEADRFFLTIATSDLGVEHIWHEDGEEIVRVLDDDLLEVTDEVRRRAPQIREAVRNGR